MEEPEIVKIMEKALSRIKADIKRDPKIGSHFIQHLTYREIVQLTEYIIELKKPQKTPKLVFNPRDKS